jgi:hypothetical protein
MKSKGWPVLAVVILALVVGMFASPASAVTKRQEKRWIHHHPNYTGSSGGGKLHLLSTSSTEGTTCKTYRISFVRDYREWFLAKFTAWHFNAHYTWCWRDGKVISASHYIDHGVAGWSGWQWEGFDYHVSGSGVNSSGVSYRYWRDKATFKFCFAYLLPICYYKHPWVAMTVRGDGSHYYCDDRDYCNGKAP